MPYGKKALGLLFGLSVHLKTKVSLYLMHGSTPLVRVKQTHDYQRKQTGRYWRGPGSSQNRRAANHTAPMCSLL